jgi:DNA-binding response OmpR family regulator
MTQRLLNIEDDPALGQMLAMHFEDAGCVVGVAQTYRSGLEALAAGVGRPGAVGSTTPGAGKGST